MIKYLNVTLTNQLLPGVLGMFLNEWLQTSHKFLTTILRGKYYIFSREKTHVNTCKTLVKG